MLRPIVKYGTAGLQARAATVATFDHDLSRLIDDMIETMYAAPGIGLAAPQVGVPLRVCVLDLSVGKKGGEVIELVNPEFAEREGMQIEDEGCLSVPGFTATVPRPARVVVRGVDRTGRSRTVEGTGLLARALQHELDHLDGTLFLDRLRGIKRDLIKEDPQARSRGRVVMPLRVAFLGTPAFAVASLDHLLASPHQVAVVVTQPDRARGRGQKVAPSPVKVRAEAAAVPILQPERMRDEAFLSALAGFGVDLAVVAAYGKLLPQRLLDLPTRGTINVHASLLPRWRGAAPIHRAVIAGDTETGVTIMRVVLALDAGPMLAKTAVPIREDETSAELESRLAEAGARLLIETIDRLSRDEIAGESQDEELVTYAARLERSDSQIDWGRPSRAIHNQIRGLQPWPLAAVMLHGRRILLLHSIPDAESGIAAEPGVIVRVDAEAIVVAARPGLLRVTRLQPEGRAPMAVRDFLNGRHVVAGDRFEPTPITS